MNGNGKARSALAMALLAMSGAASAVPILVAPLNFSLNQSALLWTADRDPDGPFSVYLGTSLASQTLIASQLTTLSYSLSPLAPANYFWQVVNRFDERSSIGSFSVQALPPTPAPAPNPTLLMAVGLVGLTASRWLWRRGPSGHGRPTPP